MTVIGLRAATPDDSGYCYRLHRAAMRGYVAAIWGWDESDQRAYHERGFDPTRTQIVTLDGMEVGALSVEYRPAETYLARIEIDPQYQGRGIGSALIRQLVDAGRRPVVLDVRAVALRRTSGVVRRDGAGACP